MSDELHTTTLIPGRRMTEVLTQDQGEGRIRISHESGLPVAGDTQTETSKFEDQWELNVSNPETAYDVVNVVGDPHSRSGFRREVNRILEQAEADKGHNIDVRGSYEFECHQRVKPKVPHIQESVKEPILEPVQERVQESRPLTMRAISNDVPPPRPERQDSIWLNHLLVMLASMSFGIVMGWAIQSIF